ncbi:MAG: 4Fe-4S binding protein [Spirochaetales bacterium]|nr:4Fe-4S binding protein [Spirochaetales bacterium]
MTRAVIQVDPEKCVNCHQCIKVCPSKFCNDGAGDHIELDPNLCIGCGSCIDVCTHGARYGVDDVDAFFESVEICEDLVAIVAPAAASNFPDEYLNLNGWLKELGVRAVFDVSFGAELTVKSYLEAIKNDKIKNLIAQPCPSIVRYIELYHPELIPFLAPADSPMLHTMKMIKSFYPKYSKSKIVIISPCYGKRNEFDDVGIGDYNLTFRSINDFFSKKNIKLSQFPAVDYDNPPAERAVLFSTPGGLLRTAEREVPGISLKSRKIEGVHTVYKYLDKLVTSLESGTAPFLVDCLSCEMGCNGGSGTLNRDEAVDNLDFFIEKRGKTPSMKILDRMKIRKLHKFINKYWKPGLYNRSYTDKSGIVKSLIKLPSVDEIDEIHRSMYKFKDSDFLNCDACGYGNCEQFAIAVFNGKNRKENCRHYQEISIEKTIMESNALVNEQRTETLRDVLGIFSDIENLINSLNSEIVRQASIVVESSSAIEQMIANIISVNKIIFSNSETVKTLSSELLAGKENLTKVCEDISQIANLSENLIDVSSVIQNISRQTNLLSMNASIEAAHAGDSGRGFAIVADEVRNLAESSGTKAKTISSVLKSVNDSVQIIVQSVNELDKKFGSFESEVEKVSDQETVAKNAMAEQSSGGEQMLEAIETLNQITQRVKDDSRNLLSTSENIKSKLLSLIESANHQSQDKIFFEEFFSKLDNGSRPSSETHLDFEIIAE